MIITKIGKNISLSFEIKVHDKDYGMLRMPWFLCFFIVRIALSNEMSSWEGSVYNPQEYGLKSLSFEARIDGLVERVRAALIIPNITHIYFKVNWDRKRKFSIETMGLPKGFSEIKNILEQTLLDKLKFFIPENQFISFRDYHVTTQRKDSGTLFILEDKSYLKEITKLEAYFDKEKKLSKMEILGTNRWEINSFQFEALIPGGKLFLKKFEVENLGSHGAFVTSYSVDYSKIGLFYFPKNIDTISRVQTRASKDGKEQVLSEAKSAITFSNFSVN